MLKAISLHQPWASAVPAGVKPDETRHWKTALRGELAIHAAKKWDGETADWWRLHAKQHGFPNQPPLGCIVAVVTLLNIVPTEERLTAITKEQEGWGNYGPKRFAWMLGNVRPLRHPVMTIGRQSIWTLPPEIEAAVWREVAS
jgi:hypothetical protein